jgi:carbon monoxide dehydrogenase subunit G
MDIQSRIGVVQSNQKEVFYLLSDFRNLAKYIPVEQVIDLKFDENSCSFQIKNIGKFGMQFKERIPDHQVKIVNDESVPFKFELFLNLTPISDKATQVQAFLKADLNPFLKLVAQKPLTNFVEALIIKLETYNKF